MATTPIEFHYHGGQTLTADLVAADDTLWASSLGATELTNGDGRYRVNYTGTNTGHCTLIVKLDSTVVGVFHYNLEDTTSVQYDLETRMALDADLNMAGTADAVLNRGASNIEDSADRHSLGAMIMISTNSSISGGTLTAKKPSDDSTFDTYTITTDAGADPITGVS